jgi:tRNA threonylcarbamoyladenosine biosynthesis protein TsaB
LLAEVGADSANAQSVALWGDIDRLLQLAGVVLGDLAAVAVCTGPGSFTGLRVGVAAAAGLARALRAPLYGISSLELHAWAAGGEEVWTVLNAYRGEVYAQHFELHGDEATALAEPLVAPPDEVLASFGPGPLSIAGDWATPTALGAAAQRAGVTVSDASGWQLVESPVLLAPSLGLLAARRHEAGRAPATLRPCYVRRSEAEINLQRRREEQMLVS